VIDTFKIGIKNTASGELFKREPLGAQHVVVISGVLNLSTQALHTVVYVNQLFIGIIGVLMKVLRAI
jgi:hypothetical protein